MPSPTPGFVAELGLESLAGIALVIPLITLMLNVANGGMGGGVASAVARALGAGRLADARAIVMHALALSLALGLLFTLFAWTVAPALYRLLGGTGPALQQAVVFSHVWFSAAVPMWAAAFLSAVLRGGGDAATPARIGLVTALLYTALSGMLTLGLGPLPGFGLAGMAAASVIMSVVTVAVLARALWRGGPEIVPTFADLRPQRRLFAEILSVGMMGSLTTVTANLTAMILTGLVGRFGIAALAGYGIGVRLEFMVAPLAFGIGTGAITLVGVAAGAGHWRRAVRVAWTGGLAAFATIGVIGWTLALLAESWSRLFTADPSAIAASVSYITHVAPFYCLFGLGLSLNFASQGAGRMVAPVMAGIARLVVTTGGGWLAIEWMGLGLGGVFAAIALGLATYGGLLAGTLLVSPWRARRG